MKIKENDTQNLPQKHFETKFPHTEIKHKLLSNTLNSSIYITNHFTEEFLSKEFVLVDLFAGAGAFDDGTKGSPIIALETITNYMKKAVNRNFNKFTLIFIEKDKENHKSLIKNIAKKIKKEDSQCKMEIIIAADDWEHYNTAIQNYLDKTQAAFVFVDPFSTELKIDKLKTLIHPNKYHSMLILINLSGLERTLGHKNEKSLQKICDYFDVDEETIRKLEETGNLKKSDVLEITNERSKASLLAITSCLYDDFYSWKNATEKEVPTSSNLCRAVNSLISDGKIKLCTTEFTRKPNSNMLLAEAFSSKARQEKVVVERVRWR
ncbi:MAG: three-Cys-motif partner protein TcmP [Heliobacteriaceae bacterium]|jgi:three-Cys-motif partner protein|nr:three-Cys-motif partner protein TcmP [Heliobacteriaceae bacterium]